MNFRQLATTFVSTGTPFGLFMALIFGFQFGEWWGAVAGVAAGILFGSAITLFVLLMSNRMRIRDNFENEPVCGRNQPITFWVLKRAEAG